MPELNFVVKPVGDKETVSALKNVDSAYQAVGTTSTRTFQEAGKAASLFGGSMGEIRNILLGMAGTIGVMGIAEQLREWTHAAIEGEKAWANVTTLLDQSREYTDELYHSLKMVSAQVGTTADLAKGMYMALSANVKPEKAVQFMTDAAKFAKAAVTDTFTSVDLLTTVLNAYGLATEEAVNVSDKLFQMVRKGKTTGDMLANSLGMVIPTAAALKVDLNELGAAFATMTQMGISAHMATTSLNQALVAFLHPTKQAKELAKQLHVELSAASLKTNGLATSMATLAKAAQGNDEAITLFFGNIRAMRAALALTGEQAQTYRQFLDDMRHSTGLTNEAFDKQVNTFGAQMEAFWINLGKIWKDTLDTGGQLTDMLKGMNQWMEKGEKPRSEMKAGLLGAVTAIGLLATPKLISWVQKATESMLTFGGALTKGQAGLVILGAAVAAFTLKYIYDEIDKYLQKMAQMDRVQALLTDKRWPEMRKRLQELGYDLSSMPMDEIVKLVDDLGKAADKEEFFAIQSETMGKKVLGLSDQADKLIKSLEGMKDGAAKTGLLRSAASELRKEFDRVIQGTEGMAGATKGLVVDLKKGTVEYKANREIVEAQFKALDKIKPQLLAVREAFRSAGVTVDADTQALFDNWDALAKEIPALQALNRESQALTEAQTNLLKAFDKGKDPSAEWNTNIGFLISRGKDAAVIARVFSKEIVDSAQATTLAGQSLPKYIAQLLPLAKAHEDAKTSAKDAESAEKKYKDVVADVDAVVAKAKSTLMAYGLEGMLPLVDQTRAETAATLLATHAVKNKAEAEAEAGKAVEKFVENSVEAQAVINKGTAALKAYGLEGLAPLIEKFRTQTAEQLWSTKAVKTREEAESEANKQTEALTAKIIENADALRRLSGAEMAAADSTIILREEFKKLGIAMPDEKDTAKIEAYLARMKGATSKLGIRNWAYEIEEVQQAYEDLMKDPGVPQWMKNDAFLAMLQKRAEAGQALPPEYEGQLEKMAQSTDAVLRGKALPIWLDFAEKSKDAVTGKLAEPYANDLIKIMQGSDRMLKKSLLPMWEDYVEACRDINGKLPPWLNKLNDKIIKDQEKATGKLEEVWKNQISTIFTDFSKGVADIIFEGKSMTETLNGIFKEFGKMVVRTLIEAMFDPIKKMLQDLVKKIFDWVDKMSTKVADTVSDTVANSVSEAQQSSTSGFMGIPNLIGPLFKGGGQAATTGAGATGAWQGIPYALPETGGLGPVAGTMAAGAAPGLGWEGIWSTGAGAAAGAAGGAAATASAAKGIFGLPKGGIGGHGIGGAAGGLMTTAGAMMLMDSLHRKGAAAWAEAIGGGAMAGLAIGGPIGAAVGALVGLTTRLVKLAIGKKADEAGAMEVTRDLGGISMNKETFKGYYEGLGMTEPQAYPIRKDLMMAPKFLAEIAGPAAMAQGKMDSFLKSLENVTTAWGTFSFREEYELGELTGDWSKLDAKYKDVFEHSAALQQNLPQWEDILLKNGNAAKQTAQDFQNLYKTWIEGGEFSQDFVDFLEKNKDALDEAAASSSLFAKELDKARGAAEAFKVFQPLIDGFKGLRDGLNNMVPAVKNMWDRFIETGEITDELKAKVAEFGGDITKFEEAAKAGQLANQFEVLCQAFRETGIVSDELRQMFKDFGGDLTALDKAAKLKGLTNLVGSIQDLKQGLDEILPDLDPIQQVLSGEWGADTWEKLQNMGFDPSKFVKMTDLVKYERDWQDAVDEFLEPVKEGEKAPKLKKGGTIAQALYNYGGEEGRKALDLYFNKGINTITPELLEKVKGSIDSAYRTERTGLMEYLDSVQKSTTEEIGTITKEIETAMGDVATKLNDAFNVARDALIVELDKILAKLDEIYKSQSGAAASTTGATTQPTELTGEQWLAKIDSLQGEIQALTDEMGNLPGEGEYGPGKGDYYRMQGQLNALLAQLDAAQAGYAAWLAKQEETPAPETKAPPTSETTAPGPGAGIGPGEKATGITAPTPAPTVTVNVTTTAPPTTGIAPAQAPPTAAPGISNASPAPEKPSEGTVGPKTAAITAPATGNLGPETAPKAVPTTPQVVLQPGPVPVAPAAAPPTAVPVPPVSEVNLTDAQIQKLKEAFGDFGGISAMFSDMNKGILELIRTDLPGLQQQIADAIKQVQSNSGISVFPELQQKMLEKLQGVASILEDVKKQNEAKATEATEVAAQPVQPSTGFIDVLKILAEQGKTLVIPPEFKLPFDNLIQDLVKVKLPVDTTGLTVVFDKLIAAIGGQPAPAPVQEVEVDTKTLADPMQALAQAIKFEFTKLDKPLEVSPSFLDTFKLIVDRMETPATPMEPAVPVLQLPELIPVAVVSVPPEILDLLRMSVQEQPVTPVPLPVPAPIQEEFPKLSMTLEHFMTDQINALLEGIKSGEDKTLVIPPELSELIEKYFQKSQAGGYVPPDLIKAIQDLSALGKELIPLIGQPPTKEETELSRKEVYVPPVAPGRGVPERPSVPTVQIINNWDFSGARIDDREAFQEEVAKAIQDKYDRGGLRYLRGR